MRDNAAIRVGFKRFFCWQCVNMLLYVWVLRSFLWAMCDYAAIRVGSKGFVSTLVDTRVNTLANSLVNTHVNTLVNTHVNILVNTHVNTPVNTLANTL